MEFQGFQSAYSTLFVVLFAIALIAIAFISYRRQQSLSPKIQLLLSSIRSVTFILLMLLVLNPFFFSSSEEEQNPKILFLFDNSESVTISKGDYAGIVDYEALLDNLAINQPTGVEADYFSFGSTVRQIQNVDSLYYNEPATNLINAITQVQELAADYSAAVIISDGIITFGRNPLITASNLDIPIYSIGLGDTSKVRDVTINNIITNATGYTETRHEVEIEIAQNGFEGASAEVNVLNSEGEIISSEVMVFTSSEGVINSKSEFLLENEGLLPFKVEVIPLTNEWSIENNTRSFSIDVQDSKTRVLHVSSEIHPDVKFIRSILSTNPSIELQTLTWIGGNRFVEQITPEFDDLDLIILHGDPNQIPSIEINNAILSVPSVYLDLPGTRRNFSVDSDFVLIRNMGAQVFEMGIFQTANIESHPILEMDEISYDVLAPILSSLRTETIAADAVTLFNSSFQGIATENPLLSLIERGDLRRVHISAWGWYRLYQSPSKEERNFVSQLFTNIVSWSSNNPDNRRLKISPTKSSFNSAEQVIINASLINESGNPEPGATIEIHISSQDSEERVFNLNNLGSGNYSITLDALNTGLFSFTATARKDARIIDEQSGEFIIEHSNVELINTLRNDDLLNAISNETRGKFYPFNASENFWSDIQLANLLDRKSVTIESYHYPVRSFFWFILVILLLGVEWVLRKHYSLP